MDVQVLAIVHHLGYNSRGYTLRVVYEDRGSNYNVFVKTTCKQLWNVWTGCETSFMNNRLLHYNLGVIKGLNKK